jgi:cysteine desulfurase
MLPWLGQHFGNPASATHAYGWTAAAGIKKARASLAAAINASPEEIIFTSGATEANNLAIKGVAEAGFNRGRHLITVQTEHNAVLDPCRYLEGLGFAVTYLPVGADGLINLEDLEAAFRQDTLLVSVMAANNEIGVLQPLAEIGQRCRDRGVLFHSDGAQANR